MMCGCHLTAIVRNCRSCWEDRLLAHCVYWRFFRNTGVDEDLLRNGVAFVKSTCDGLLA